MDRHQLRVLYVSPRYTTHDRRFLCSFAESGWDVAYMPLLDRALERRPLPEGVRALAWPGESGDLSDTQHWAGQRDAMKAVLLREKPDAVIAGTVHSGACVAAHAAARPLVTVLWGSDILVDSFRDETSLESTRFTLAHSDAVFGDCRAVRDVVRNHATMADDRIVAFPWGIDLERFSPDGPVAPVVEQLGWTDKEIFISTRTWEPLYAIDVLVNAFALVSAQRPAARLLLLADGSLADRIHRLVTELDLTHVIHTPGRLSYEDLPQYFRAATVYVSSALSDGTSVSLLEAMACGLPVVVTASYGNLEWVEEGVNGALAEPGDAASLARAMLRIAGDPVAQSEMSATNIDTARTRANWDANFPRLRDMVESLVSR